MIGIIIRALIIAASLAIAIPARAVEIGGTNESIEGVALLHGCNKSEVPSIENISAGRLLIQNVWQYQGEKTQWIRHLDHNQKMPLASLDHFQDGFYIYQALFGGGLVGFLHCDRK